MFKKFSIAMGLAMGCSLVAFSGNAVAKNYKLKLGTIMPTDHPNGLGAVHFANLVKQKTGGHVTVSVFPSSQLGNEKEQFDQVEMGSLDFTILGYGEPGKREKDISILDAPFLAKDRAQLVRVLNSKVIQDIFTNMPKHMGAQAIGGFYYGARYLTTKNKIVRSPKDMKGLNIRVPDQKLYIDTLTAMGARATPMSFGEVFLALQQGVIQGQENPLATIANNKFDQVQKYLIQTQHIIGANAIYMSTSTMKKLPKAYVAKIKQAGLETAHWIDKKAFAQEDKFLAELQKRGMKLIKITNKAPFMKATQKIYKDYDPKLVKAIRAVK